MLEISSLGKKPHFLHEWPDSRFSKPLLHLISSVALCYILKLFQEFAEQL